MKRKLSLLLVPLLVLSGCNNQEISTLSINIPSLPSSSEIKTSEESFSDDMGRVEYDENEQKAIKILDQYAMKVSCSYYDTINASIINSKSNKSSNYIFSNELLYASVEDPNINMASFVESNVEYDFDFKKSELDKTPLDEQGIANFKSQVSEQRDSVLMQFASIAYSIANSVFNDDAGVILNFYKIKEAYDIKLTSTLEVIDNTDFDLDAEITYTLEGQTKSNKLTLSYVDGKFICLDGLIKLSVNYDKDEIANGIKQQKANILQANVILMFNNLLEAIDVKAFTAIKISLLSSQAKQIVTIDSELIYQEIIAESKTGDKSHYIEWVDGNKLHNVDVTNNRIREVDIKEEDKPGMHEKSKETIKTLLTDCVKDVYDIVLASFLKDTSKLLGFYNFTGVDAIKDITNEINAISGSTFIVTCNYNFHYKDGHSENVSNVITFTNGLLNSMEGVASYYIDYEPNITIPSLDNK